MFTRRDFLRLLSATGLLASSTTLGQMAAGAAGAGDGKGTGAAGGAAPDRLAVLARHAVRVRSADPSAVLSVGNGRFAFNVDCTGLQSLAAEYKTIPLATLSHWAWHSMPMPAGMDPANYRYKQYPFHGRQIGYSTDAAGQQALYDYMRENPHRLNLGRIGLVLDGKALTVAALSGIEQTLDMHTGVVKSSFTLAGEKVTVTTCCHADFDGIAVRIESALVTAKRLGVQIAFPYGSISSSSDGGDWTKPNAHTTSLFNAPAAPLQVTLNRKLDAMQYGARVGWTEKNAATVEETAAHTYLVRSVGGIGGGDGAGPLPGRMDLAIAFDPEPNRATPLFSFEEAMKASADTWHTFWMNGAAIDLGDCTDPRAPELERRIVLSQYLTAIHCSGQYPSQETGLLCNSWFGKFHLEMHWWHSVHFSAWSRQKYFGRSMFIYTKLLESAKARAKRQGFAGARWPKMIGPDGEDSPSPIGPLLIWQQPHPIYYAELCYRDDPTIDTLKRWKEIVVSTAEFMASYAQMDDARKMYVLGPSMKTVSENEDTATTLNPTYEVTAWRFGLSTANKWLERMGEPRNADWDKVINGLAPAPKTADGAVYLMQEGQDTYSTKWAYEHPALLGAMGVLPGELYGIDAKVMTATVKKVRETWDFARVWGWDFPMAAMAAARTGQGEMAIDFLLMDAPMNKYLPNGCNFQRDNVPAYFPGNGGLLSAIALMSAGWSGGPKGSAPGFPTNGKWKVRVEGFREWI